MYKDRIHTLQTQLRAKKTAHYFITNQINIFYLTGFRGISPHERECSLLVTKSDVHLFIPRMYKQTAEVLPTVTDGLIKLVVDEERDGILSMFRHYLNPKDTLFVEEHDLRVNEFRYLEDIASDMPMDARQVVERLRTVKDPSELKLIQKAVSITDASVNELVAYLKTIDYEQYTELDIVDALAQISRKLGGEGFSFDPVVACGKPSAEPHYRTQNNKLKKGQPLLIDLGIYYKGYTSDLTRTYFLGKAPDEFRNIYDTVLACNRAAIAHCRAGISAGMLHDASVEFFAKRNLAEYYLHGLGHGVGLDIHEEPFFRKGRGSELLSGMIVTLEPGLYFAGKYGIRIEDYVHVRESDCEVLSNNSPKELIEI